MTGRIAERNERNQVREQLVECDNDGESRRLRIGSRNTLTSLPPIPSNVIELVISECPFLLNAPDISGCTRLEIFNIDSCSSLVGEVDVSHCPQLTTLSIYNCASIVVSPDLSQCRLLQTLTFASCTGLTEAPDVRQCEALQTLNMTDCPSVRNTPDWSQSTNLRRINIVRCTALASIPPVRNLQELLTLNLCDTPLTSLPDDILHLRRACFIALDASRLSDAVRNRLAETMNQPHYRGPEIQYTMGHASPSLEIRPLGEEVNAWHAEILDASQGIFDQAFWSTLSGRENSMTFSMFLARIRETNDYRHATPILKAATQRRVGALLKQLGTDPALREDCCNLATDAVDTCGDRVALRLMDMEMLCLTRRAMADIDSGRSDSNPQAVIELCKGQC